MLGATKTMILELAVLVLVAVAGVPEDDANDACEPSDEVEFLQAPSARPLPPLKLEPQPSDEPNLWSFNNPDPSIFEWSHTGYWALPRAGIGCRPYDAGNGRLCSEEEKNQGKQSYADVTESDWRTIKVGYLKVPLDYDTTKPASNITLQLRVSAMIGASGPNAPLLLQHNGGPQTDDYAVLSSQWWKLKYAYPLYEAIDEKYTLLGIQQRGVSDSSESNQWPVKVLTKQFKAVCDGKHHTPTTNKNHYVLKDFTSCECDLPEDGQEVPNPFPDPDNESETASWFRFAASRNRNCYGSDFWKITDSQSKSTYNFLDYVGTWYLAKDIDRLRQAFGAEKLSISGISYGTAVGSAYAAIFPKNVDKLILNGNVHPGPNVEDYYASTALASRQVMVKLVKMCRNKQLVGEDMSSRCKSPGFDPVQFFLEVVAKIRKNPDAYSAPTDVGTKFVLTPAMLYNFLNLPLYKGILQLWGKALQTMDALGGSNESARQDAILEVFGSEYTCCKDWKTYGYCAEYMMYSTNTRLDGGLTENAVRAMDYAGRYTPTDGVQFYREVKEKFHGVEVYFANIKAGFGLLTWPGEPTPVMLGSRAGVEALIVNPLYDRATPHYCAKLMRAAFPDGVLMTWQGIGHAINPSFWDSEGFSSCLAAMRNYLLTGLLPPDGFTCHQTKLLA